MFNDEIDQIKPFDSKNKKIDSFRSFKIKDVNAKKFLDEED